MSNSKIKSQKQNVNQKLSKNGRKKSANEKAKQKFSWSIAINFVPFENDNIRQKSYELWVESLFHHSN
jgi:hypothetical protein